MTEMNAPADGGQGGAPAAGNWIEAIPDADLKGWAQNKGFKEPTDALNSYRNLEKLMGADKAGRTVVLPAKWDDAAEVGAFYEKLGRPKDPGGYTMPKEGVDADMAKWAQSTFHEAGLTPRQAELVIGKWQEMIGGKAAATQEAYQARVAQESEALKGEWGAAYNDKLAQAKSAAKSFGVDPETVDKLENALGFGGLMKFFAEIGARIGEDKMVSGTTNGSFNGAMTPEQARAEIQRLRGDNEFVRRYVAGDADSRMKMERLHRWAFGEGPVA
jgi:hypothetical protein